MRITVKHLRKLDMTLLPPGGGWVSVKGNPYAKRGCRIPRSITDLGVQHMDIYWGFEEKTAWNYECDYNLWRGCSDRAKRDLIDEKTHTKTNNSLQITLMRVLAPAPEIIKFYNGELALMSYELISDMLAEDLVETVSFDANNPIIDDVTRDLVGSAQVEGMSLSEAQDYFLSYGMIKPKHLQYPNYFYRPIGEYKTQFVEEAWR